jgi:hypothetical protein
MVTCNTTGTGQQTADGRFMENPQLYRTIAAPGDADLLPATIEAVPELINTKSRENVLDELAPRRWARDNLLHLQIIIPDTITSYDVHVFGTMIGEEVPVGVDKWSYVFRQECYERSQFITLEQVPHGEVKVLISNVVGSGDVSVLYSITD